MEIKRENWATRWGGAFPVGNGHLGGMVYGNPHTEQIDLSEITFFSGEKSAENNQKGASGAFQKMRNLIQDNNYEGAQKVAESFVGVQNNYGTNLPVGTLLIEYENAGKITEYSRTLDLFHGVAVASYRAGGVLVRTETFVSHPARVLCYHMESERPLCLSVRFEAENPAKERYDGGGLDFQVFAREAMHSDGKTGVDLSGKLAVRTDGQTSGGERLEISGARTVTLYLTMETDFKKDEDLSQIAEEQSDCMHRSMDTGYDALKREHMADFESYMRRVDLQLDSLDLELIPLMFQYGRYLLLSSSREDSELPCHLQGVWNDNVACRIGWTCDMHLDINTQMNYWSAEITNLAETAAPLFRWIENDLVPEGRETARKSYGLDGWVAELVSNAWGFAAPYWAPSLSPCPTGGVWVLTHMWEHYLFTGDMDFLSRHVYPLVREATLFFIGYLFQNRDGYYVSGPSISPENSFLFHGIAYQNSIGCTYEILMVRELFDIFLQAAALVKEKDAELIRKVKERKERLLPYRIKEDGRISEWADDLQEADPQHRHTSHLLGLFPFHQIAPEATPELCRAAQRTIDRKLNPAEGWEDTGWARSMLMLYEARLGDGNRAWRHVQSMLEHLLEENDFIIHPPTRGAPSFDNVYELDGNTGLTTAIAQILLQSRNGTLYLLPALPDEWQNGQVSGLVAEGGIEVKMTWQNGKLTGAFLKAAENITCDISYDHCVTQQTLIGGCWTQVNFGA